MLRFLKVQSVALWAAILSILNIGIAFSWWQMTPTQIGTLNTAFAAVILVLRQMFSITDAP